MEYASTELGLDGVQLEVHSVNEGAIGLYRGGCVVMLSHYLQVLLTEPQQRWQ